MDGVPEEECRASRMGATVSNPVQCSEEEAASRVKVDVPGGYHGAGYIDNGTVLPQHHVPPKSVQAVASKEPKALFTAADRANPPRCLAKLLGYLVLSPCIIIYLVAQMLGKCMWHFCACIDRVCEMSSMCIERMCKGLAAIQAACCSAICRGLDLLYRYTIGALLHAIYEYIMVPIYTLILFPICRLLWMCAASFAEAVSTASRLIYNNILLPLYRGIAWVTSAVAGGARAVGRFIYNFWIVPIKYALSYLYGRLCACCGCIWRGVKAVGKLLYRLIIKPIYSVLQFFGRLLRDYVIRPLHFVAEVLILAPARCVLRGLGKLCAGLRWGVVMLVTHLVIIPTKLVYRYVLLPPLRLLGQAISIVLRVVGAVLDAVRTAITNVLRAIASLFK